MTRWVDALGTLVDERIGQPVVVLGHSMGTILALEAWAPWPERIRAAIFVGGVPQVAPRIRERLSERVRALSGAADLVGWGKRVSPGVFSHSTFVDRPEVVAAFERLFELQSVEAYVRCCTDPARGERRADRADRDRPVPGDHRRTRPIRAA